jgi:hypothetical protein
VNGEVSPAERPDDAPAELRASHADRDRVVEELRIAAGDGRLTAEELDERLEAALTARTYRELAVLTADLPAAGTQPGAASTAQPKDLIRVVRHGGNAKHTGRWVVPKRMEIQVTGGNARLDFTEAVITQPTLHIDMHLKGGNFIIVTRPGVVVDTNDVVAAGGQIKVRTADGPQTPVVLAIEMSGDLLGGNMRVGPPRRTFWQWLTRRPAGPGGSSTS